VENEEDLGLRLFYTLSFFITIFIL